MSHQLLLSGEVLESRYVSDIKIISNLWQGTVLLSREDDALFSLGWQSTRGGASIKTLIFQSFKPVVVSNSIQL